MKDDADTIMKCGCYALILVFNFCVGGWSVNYLLDFFVNKTLPFFWAGVIGAFAGEISVPVAVVIAILHNFGVV